MTDTAISDLSVDLLDKIDRMKRSNAESAIAAMQARAGWRTSEFWIALAVATAGIFVLTTSASAWAQIAGGTSAALASMGYGSSRARVKTT